MDSNQRGTTGYADRPTPPTPPTPPPDVGQVVDQAKETGKQVVDQVQEQAFSRLGDQIDRARESVGAVAEATRSVGQQLRRSDQGFVADYVDQAAGQIERFAGYLENKSVDELMYDAERFARRQPAMFLGGAFVLGVLAARFLKSSAAAAGPRYDDRDYARYGARGGYPPRPGYNPYSSDYAMYGAAQRPPYEPTV